MEDIGVGVESDRLRCKGFCCRSRGVCVVVVVDLGVPAVGGADGESASIAVAPVGQLDYNSRRWRPVLRAAGVVVAGDDEDGIEIRVVVGVDAGVCVCTGIARWGQGQGLVLDRDGGRRRLWWKIIRSVNAWSPGRSFFRLALRRFQGFELEFPSS